MIVAIGCALFRFLDVLQTIKKWNSKQLLAIFKAGGVHRLCEVKGEGEKGAPMSLVLHLDRVHTPNRNYCMSMQVGKTFIFRVVIPSRKWPVKGSPCSRAQNKPLTNHALLLQPDSTAIIAKCIVISTK